MRACFSHRESSELGDDPDANSYFIYYTTFPFIYYYLLTWLTSNACRLSGAISRPSTWHLQQENNEMKKDLNEEGKEEHNSFFFLGGPASPQVVYHVSFNSVDSFSVFFFFLNRHPHSSLLCGCPAPLFRLWPGLTKKKREEIKIGE